jgi:hypothetical protein
MNEIEEEYMNLFYRMAADYHLTVTEQSYLLTSSDSWVDRYDTLLQYIQLGAR